MLLRLPCKVVHFEKLRRKMKRNARTLVLRGEKWMVAASLPYMDEVCGHLYGEGVAVKVEEENGLLRLSIYALTPELAERVEAELKRGVEVFRRAESAKQHAST